MQSFLPLSAQSEIYTTPHQQKVQMQMQHSQYLPQAQHQQNPHVMNANWPAQNRMSMNLLPHSNQQNLNLMNEMSTPICHSSFADGTQIQDPSSNTPPATKKKKTRRKPSTDSQNQMPPNTTTPAINPTTPPRNAQAQVYSSLPTPAMTRITTPRNKQVQALTNMTTPTMNQSAFMCNPQLFNMSDAVDGNGVNSPFLNNGPNVSPLPQFETNATMNPQSAPQLRNPALMYSPNQLPAMPQTQPFMRRSTSQQSQMNNQMPTNMVDLSQVSNKDLMMQIARNQQRMQQAARGSMNPQNFNHMSQGQNPRAILQQSIQQLPALQACRKMAQDGTQLEEQQIRQMAHKAAQAVYQKVAHGLRQAQFQRPAMSMCSPSPDTGHGATRPRETVTQGGSPLGRTRPDQQNSLQGQSEMIPNVRRPVRGLGNLIMSPTSTPTAMPLQSSLLVNGPRQMQDIHSQFQNLKAQHHHTVNGQFNNTNGHSVNMNGQIVNSNGPFHNFSGQLHNMNGQHLGADGQSLNSIGQGFPMNGIHHNMHLINQSQHQAGQSQNSRESVSPLDISNPAQSHEALDVKRKRTHEDGDKAEVSALKKIKKPVKAADPAEKPKIKRGRKPNNKNANSINTHCGTTAYVATTANAVTSVTIPATTIAADAVVGTPLETHIESYPGPFLFTNLQQEVAQPTTSIVASIEESGDQIILQQSEQIQQKSADITYVGEETNTVVAKDTTNGGKDTDGLDGFDHYVYRELTKASVNAPHPTADAVIEANTEADNLTDYDTMMQITEHLMTDALRSPTPPDLGLTSVGDSIFDFFTTINTNEEELLESKNEMYHEETASDLTKAFKDTSYDQTLPAISSDEPTTSVSTTTETTDEKATPEEPQWDHELFDDVVEDMGWTKDDISLFGDEVEVAGEGTAE